MKRQIVQTADGSTTIHIEDWDEHYHSKHGAIQEAYHVFIKSGLDHYLKTNQTSKATILEMGFGTGLNAFITLIEAQNRALEIDYVGLEAYPISDKEAQGMNYVEALSAEGERKYFEQLHQVAWEVTHTITPQFNLKKRKERFEGFCANKEFDLIYFDAFGARVQPELWTESIFQRMFDALKPKGILVTYAAKGSVRRAMQTAGFMVERLPGPPGKREMLRATRPKVLNMN